MPSPELHIVILAAGKGSRMRSEQPKVLHKVAGKAILAHVIEAALFLQPEKIHVVVGHKKRSVMAAFKGWDINWVEQSEQLGTGHAVKQATPHIPDSANVLLLVGDAPLIGRITLEQLLACMTSFPLALLTALVEDPSGLGRITRNQDNNVSGIVEHKDASTQQLAIKEVNSGFLCARAAPLKKWLSKINNDNVQREYYLTDTVALACAEGAPVCAVHPIQNHEVLGINSRVELAKAERLFQQAHATQLQEAGVTLIDPQRIDIRGNVNILTDTVIDVNCVIEGPNTTIGKNVSIAPNCVIINSTIGDDCQINANTVIENAVLGRNVTVGPFARLRPGTELADSVKIGNFVETKNARFAEGSKANHLSYVGDSEIGSSTNIGAGVITCNYDGANKYKTHIGDNVFIGSDSQLVAPVSIADGATIGAGSTITNDVAKDQLAISRGRQRQIDGWQRPQKKNT